MFLSLTVGSAIGSIRDLFAKVKAVDAKHGKFDLVLCTGDFFGPKLDRENEADGESETNLLLEGKLEGTAPNFVCQARAILRYMVLFFPAPIECYIMQGEYPLPEEVVEKFAKTGGELCKNVFLMSV